MSSRFSFKFVLIRFFDQQQSTTGESAPSLSRVDSSAAYIHTSIVRSAIPRRTLSNCTFFTKVVAIRPISMATPSGSPVDVDFEYSDHSSQSSRWPPNLQYMGTKGSNVLWLDSTRAWGLHHTGEVHTISKQFKNSPTSVQWKEWAKEIYTGSVQILDLRSVSDTVGFHYLRTWLHTL